jgi:lipopolysaccharide biosynthesis protein
MKVVFDEAYYLNRYSDVRFSSIDPFKHYLEYGEQEGRSPHPLFDPDWYTKRHPSAVGAALRHYIQGKGAGPHPLFDDAYYLSENPDVSSADTPALIHYIRHGAAEGRSPHLLFASRWYISRYPEASSAPLVHYLSGLGEWPNPLFDDFAYRTSLNTPLRADENGLVHYLVHLPAECRPNILFHHSWYVQRAPESVRDGLNPLAHYLEYGEKNGAVPHPLFDRKYLEAQLSTENDNLPSLLVYFLHQGDLQGLSPHRLFDSSWYRSKNVDVDRSNTPALRHYLLFGWKEGRSPHPLFDVRYYLHRSPDVASGNIDPLTHYVAFGARELRNPHPLFDAHYYAAYSMDVMSAGVNILEHYLEYGGAEDRNPNLLFDSAWYRRQHESRLSSGENPLLHYVKFGASENRNPSPLFDREYYLVYNQDVFDAGIEPLGHFITTGIHEGRQPRAPDRLSEVCSVLEIPYEVRRYPPSLVGRDVCFFMTYSAHGHVHEHVLSYLDALLSQNLTVVVIVATDGLDRPLPDQLSRAHGLIVRTNHGWDFAAWATAMAVLSDVWQARTLILANDSVYGPIDHSSFGRVIEAIRKSDADLVALTDSYQAWPHVMSYFTGITSAGLRSKAVRQHWSSVRSIRTKLDVIKAYELTPLERWSEQGVQIEVLFPTADDVELPVNPTLVRWRDLLSRGFPFLKIQLLRDDLPQADPSGWEDALVGNPSLLRAINAHLAFVRKRQVDVGDPERPNPSTFRPNPAPRRRFKRNLALQTYYGATQSLRPTEATDFALEVPFGVLAGESRIDRVAVIIHIFYPDLTAAILEKVRNIPVRADLFISTDTQDKAERIRQVADAHTSGSTEIRVMPNIGRDVAPTFVGFRDVFDRYEVFLHLHSKKSPHDGLLAGWREYLLENLLGSREVVDSILLLFEQEDVGIVFSQHLPAVRPLLNWGYDYDLAKQLLKRAGVELRKDLVLEFPSSSFFWGRSSAIRPLLDLELTWSDFPAETGQVDGTVAHAIERSILFFAEAAGFRWAKVARLAGGNHDTLVPVLSAEEIRSSLARVHRPLLGNPLKPLQERRLFPELLPISTRRDEVLRPRLNLVLPTLHPTHVFGGITTALREFERLAGQLGEEYDRRVIVGNIPIDLETMIEQTAYRLAPLGSPYPECSPALVDVSDWNGGELPIRAGDIFMATAWWTATSSFELQAAQLRHFGRSHPVVYFIQDHEPGFYSWSSQFALAKATYASPEKMIALINSEELANFMARHYAYEKAYVVRYKPSLKIRTSLKKMPRERIILIYGRPGTDRNCFSTLCAGLARWQQAEPTRAQEWRIVSAGEEYSAGRVAMVANLEIKGKLTLEDYADFLSRASVGISLMMSPHPSYPPLEMAHAGLRTITNSYECKDLRLRSANIDSLDILTPDTLAEAIARAVDVAEDHVGTYVPFSEMTDLPCAYPDYDPRELADRLRGVGK